MGWMDGAMLQLGRLADTGHMGYVRHYAGRSSAFHQLPLPNLANLRCLPVDHRAIGRADPSPLIRARSCGEYETV